jgi:glucose/mannose-6-phosphate isomerase
LLPHLGNEVTETAQLLNALSGELAPMTPRNSNPAKQLVDAIGDRVPVTWGADGIGSVAAMRWKTQFNENGKIPAWWSSMSELDHNEIVGWTGSHGDRSVVIALRHAGESAELEARFRLSEEIAVESGALVREVIARGDTPLQQLMWLVMLGDFTSAYVGLRRGIDPSPVDTIMRLKAALVQA